MMQRDLVWKKYVWKKYTEIKVESANIGFVGDDIKEGTRIVNESRSLKGVFNWKTYKSSTSHC